MLAEFYSSERVLKNKNKIDPFLKQISKKLEKLFE